MIQASRRDGPLMLDQVRAPKLCEEAAFLLAEADPLRACRVLFRGLKLQARGGRQACVRWLVEELVRHDPDGLAGTVRDLHRIAARFT